MYLGSNHDRTKKYFLDEARKVCATEKHPTQLRKDFKKEWLVVLKPHLGQKPVWLAGNNSLD